MTTDNADNPGKFIINELVTSNPADVNLHIFCYEQYCEDLKTELNLLTSSNVRFHDCVPNNNPLGEEVDVEVLQFRLTSFISFIQFADPLESFLLSLSTTDGTIRKIVIVIDSLSTLLLLKDFDNVYRMLNQSVSFSERSKTLKHISSI